jgi:two-component system chemotaxis family response regulator WspR
MTAISCVVLLVDDQAMVGEALRRMLGNEADITFHFCSNPAEALETARRVMPTAILQDLVMPGVSGFALLEQYRADDQLKDIPVIVLSSKEDPVVKSEAFTAGASDYLVKLPDRVELAARIRLHSRARVNRLQRDQAYRALRLVHERLQEVTEKLRVEATHDELSGLLNRRAFFDGLQRELARSERTHEPVALILADIDHFKTINDTYGHVAGDTVIRQLGQRLRNLVRASDSVGRYGGEEFIVLAGDCPPEPANRLAERLRRSIESHRIELPGSEVSVTMSVGVAVTMRSMTAEALIAAADAALYRSKHAGRNRVELALLPA